MSGQIDWMELFFSSTGRVARGPFLIAAAVLIAIAALYEGGAADRPTLHWLTGWFVYPGLLFSACCVLSKRLHDRGRSGWLAAIVVLALIVAWPVPVGFIDFIACVVILWAVVELGVMPGEQGANRFGANPTRPAQA
ncbi:MAG: DUF805 domain-containing protein [Caulobacter sp.]|jgi:uncharacterized membrane protein YhaH (DUF805 family)|nr:DUF805 domain-containing protein [Caulobacter sp.]